jgi:hypothetical protein
VALAVATVDQGTLSAPRALVPFSHDDLLSVDSMRWSNDSTHLAVVTNVSNASYFLHLVDAIAEPPESTTVPIAPGYVMQP